MSWSLVIFYFWVALNLLLLFYVFMEFILLIFALAARKKNPKQSLENFPKVCIQLPLYNEKFVVERLIESVCAIDYPKQQMEIQLLDDSNDETSELIKNIVIQKQADGFDIHHIQRPNREGFKAGALDYGLQLTQAQFVAIFDADFIPGKDFLKTALPHFEDEKIGVIQSRWAHTNDSFSFLTKAQAIMLNTHFSIEQLGRTSSGAFINFNGTAGIWRKSCIKDAGGWQADTLTEDLDLSFRAQLKGWKFKYLYDLESPAELPVTLDAYKTQQYRWSKGAAECIRKNLKDLWRSKATFWAKLAGSMHLFNSSVYIIVLFLILSSPFVFYMGKEGLLPESQLNWISYSNLFVSTALPTIFLVGHLLASKKKWFELLLFPFRFYLFLSISIGISLYMVVGVLEGYRGKKSEFVRTPKFNLLKGNKAIISENYSLKKETNLFILEGIMLLFGLGVIGLGYFYHDYFMLAYGLMISLGYSLKLFFAKVVFRF
ncbi:MAG: glycosyltransferase [Flavobacteriales bacterium]|nr:glycosyltransferase [Flavobacteriales bacterium]